MSFLPILIFSIFANCVFSVATDVVEFVSVFEGDSLTLHTNLPQIQSIDVIEWRFGGKLTARINNMKVENERDGVELDSQTGDLTIRNIRSIDCGLHMLKIKGGKGSSSKTFNVTCMIGVNVVSVLDRDKVSKDDRIILRFEGNVAAQIDLTPGWRNVHILDKRFRNRLRLIPETGSLIITNVRTEISGFYELNITKISGGFTTHKEFKVTAVAEIWSLRVFMGICVSFLLGFTVAVAVIYCGNKICRRKERGCDFSPQREALNNV